LFRNLRVPLAFEKRKWGECSIFTGKELYFTETIRDYDLLVLRGEIPE
jgi:hypothetical protein